MKLCEQPWVNKQQGFDSLNCRFLLRPLHQVVINRQLLPQQEGSQFTRRWLADSCIPLALLPLQLEQVECLLRTQEFNLWKPLPSSGPSGKSQV